MHSALMTCPGLPAVARTLSVVVLSPEAAALVIACIGPVDGIRLFFNFSELLSFYGFAQILVADGPGSSDALYTGTATMDTLCIK